MQKTPAGDWNFTCSQRKLLGFHNPTQRPALVVINRNGLIRVLSLGHDKTRPQSQPLLDFKTEIENTTDPSDLLTHAALCPEKLADKSTSERGRNLSVGQLARLTHQEQTAQYWLQLTVLAKSFGSIESRLTMSVQ